MAIDQLIVNFLRIVKKIHPNISVHDFQFTFEGSIGEAKSTIAIATLSITTEICTKHSGVYPYFADPGKIILMMHA